MEAKTLQEMSGDPMTVLVDVSTMDTLATPVWGARMSNVKSTTSPTVYDWTLSVLSAYL